MLTKLAAGKLQAARLTIVLNPHGLERASRSNSEPVGAELQLQESSHPFGFSVLSVSAAFAQRRSNISRGVASDCAAYCYARTKRAWRSVLKLGGRPRTAAVFDSS